MTTLVIATAPGGCLPGTLHCDCGAVDLAIWDPKLGARCSYCGDCFATADRRLMLGAGTYRMLRGPHQDALIGDMKPRPASPAHGRAGVS